MEWLIGIGSIAWTSVVFLLEVVSKLITFIAVALALAWSASWIKDKVKG